MNDMVETEKDKEMIQYDRVNLKVWLLHALYGHQVIRQVDQIDRWSNGWMERQKSPDNLYLQNHL